MAGVFDIELLDEDVNQEDSEDDTIEVEEVKIQVAFFFPYANNFPKVFLNSLWLLNYRVFNRYNFFQEIFRFPLSLRK